MSHFDVDQQPSQNLNLGLHALGMIVTLCIVGGGYMICVRPMGLRFEQSRREVITLRTFVVQHATVQAEFQTLTSSLDREQELLADLLKGIPTSSHEATFLGQLSSLAESTEFAIKRFTPRESSTQSNHSFLDVDLEAEASHAAVCHFLKGLSSLPRLCKLTNLTVQRSGGEAGPYTITMRIRIYFGSGTQGKHEQGKQEQDHA